MPKTVDEGMNHIELEAGFFGQREEWLIRRISDLAEKGDLKKYVPVLESVLPLSIHELSRILDEEINNPTAKDNPVAGSDLIHDRVRSFGIIEAGRHSSRGIPLPEFLRVYKWYLQTFLDLITDQDLPQGQLPKVEARLRGIFDRLELAFVAEWTSQLSDGRIRDLQKENLELAREKQMLLTIAESLHPAFLYLDGEYRVRYMNSAGAQLLGVSRESSAWSQSRPTEVADCPGWLKKMLEEGIEKDQYPFEQTVEVSMKEESRIFQFRVNRMLDAGTTYEGFAIHGEDVTENIHFRADLEIWEERLRMATDYARVGIWDFNLVTNELVWDDTTYHLFGTSRQAHPDAQEIWDRVVPIDEQARLNAALEELVQSGTAYHVDFRIELSDEEVRYLRSQADVLRDEKGNPVRLVGVNIDITEQVEIDAELVEARRRIEETNQALRRERDLIQNYFTLVEAIIVSLDKGGRIQLLNRKGCELLGVKEKEVLGKDWFETCLPQPDGVEQLRPLFQSMMEEKTELVEYYENPIIDRVGEERIIAWHNNYMRDGNGQLTGSISAGEDITAKRAAEERLQTFVEESPIPALVAEGREMRVIRTNHSFRAVIGYDLEDIPDADQWYRLAYPDPEYRQEHIAELEKKMAAQGPPAGSIKPLESVVRCKDGSDRVFEIHHSILGDLTLVAFVDLTERKQAEEQMAQLLEDRKKFFSILGHDLRGPMGAIVGILETLVEDFPSFELEEVEELVRGVHESAANTQRLILTLLDWSRVTEGRMQPDLTQFPASKLVKTSIQDCQDVADAKQIQLIPEVPAGLVLQADFYMLNTALRNLIGNAVKFSYPESSIEIITQQNADQVVLSVQDHGQGMDEEIRSTIFNPARVKKRLGTSGEKGTGLGLSLTREFVKLHGGEIHVESEPGKGSTFIIDLPGA